MKTKPTLRELIRQLIRARLRARRYPGRGYGQMARMYAEQIRAMQK